MFIKDSTFNRLLNIIEDNNIVLKQISGAFRQLSQQEEKQLQDAAEDNLSSGNGCEPIIYPGQKVTVIVLNKEKYRGVALSYLSKDDDIIPVLILDDTAMTGSGRFIIDKFSLCDMELGWEEETE